MSVGSTITSSTCSSSGFGRRPPAEGTSLGGLAGETGDA